MMDEAILNLSSSPDTDKTLLRLRRKCEMTDVLNFLLCFSSGTFLALVMHWIEILQMSFSKKKLKKKVPCEEGDVESGREPWDAIIPLSPFL
jgi:hypothetical protein